MTPSIDASLLVSSEELNRLGNAVLRAIGVPDDDARVTIDSLVQADLWGVHSHGIRRLTWYADRLRRRGTNARPQIRVLRETAGTAVLDGDGALGQVASSRAMALAIDKAAACGTGTVTVRNSHHFGTCAYWARMAPPKGMIGLATTNGGPVMAPWGGVTPSLSNDPIGIAVPAGTQLPIVLDMATTIVAGGKLDWLATIGAKMPLGWALDASGRPTDDPVLGRAGLLLPIGEHKGFGLTVAFEVLAAVLSGSSFARQVARPPDSAQRMDVGHFFQAIDVASFMPLAEFQARVDELILQMKSSEHMAEVDAIRLPGEIETLTAARYGVEGIPMPVAVIRQLEELAENLGVERASTLLR